MDYIFPQKLISEIELGLQKKKALKIIGTANPVSIASFLSSPHFSEVYKKPQLVLTPDDATAQDLETSIGFFNPNSTVIRLEGFDVSPYSGLYPNYLSISKRIYFLYRAMYSTGGEIFIAPIKAFLQKTVPQKVLDENTYTFKLNDEISSSFIKKLSDLGYQNSPRVEDVGQFSVKGGLIDIFSPAHANPIRIDLFGDFIESLRYFSPDSQRTLEQTQELIVLPCREVIYQEGTQELVLKKLNLLYQQGNFTKEFKEQIYENLVHKKFFHGIDFLTPYFYENTSTVLDFFSDDATIYKTDALEITRQYDVHLEELKKDSQVEFDNPISPELYELYEESLNLKNLQCVDFSPIEFHDPLHEESFFKINYKTSSMTFKPLQRQEHFEEVEQKIRGLLDSEFKVLISTRTFSQAERIKVLLENWELPFHIHSEDNFHFYSLFENRTKLIEIIPRAISENIIFDLEHVAILRDEDIFGSKETKKRKVSNASAYSKSVILTDLKVGDLVVHSDFGVAVYEGFKAMNIAGVESEFIQLKFQDDDKLYLPVYRINLIRKFSGVGSVDKLGTNKWEKTKIKVRNQLKDIASDLLKLYAKRSQATRDPFCEPDMDYKTFEAQFPYDETPDQLQAINSILEDLQKNTPMDRLVCGDVGFGKTEIAMRASFKAIQERKQVGILVPTTILSFQHFESFKKRFKTWPVRIEMLSRFTPKAKVKEIILDLKEGKVDIVIGTHRLLSKDIQFKSLGLLVVDEEHKFGVTHKERIKIMKAAIDTIAMSATPIPRTLNMSLVGIRDLSLITTAPQDRLPIRTFICKFEESIIKKAIESEVQRGGQVFFLHNRVQDIQNLTEELQAMVPGVRFRFAHGQMEEDDLEKVMIAFFNHDFDVLICTTIIESGMDIPRANTIIIDRSDTLGLSQLYQLRGRVGRSKERAYCYLLVPQSGVIDPTAQERLRVLQENSDLGSGLRVAHHDLELRGAGSILGEEQSGHANAVGYELYIELLDQALKEARGEDLQIETLEPEINIRIPALIPHDYVPDIRVRMAYYNALSHIESPDDMDRYEEEMTDQFGKVPEQVMNLMGMMLLKKSCKELGVRDLSAGTKSVTLSFADFTPLKSSEIIDLVTGRPKKYSLTPDSRFVIQMAEITWPTIYSELSSLKEQVG